MPDAKVISFPLPEDTRLCWECGERPCSDEVSDWGLCVVCRRRYE